MKYLLVIALSAWCFSFPAYAEIIKGYPDLIVCEFKRGDFVAYLHGVLKNGTAVYFALDGQSLNVTPEGIIQRTGASCDGKSVNEMRKIGKAFDTVMR